MLFHNDSLCKSWCENTAVPHSWMHWEIAPTALSVPVYMLAINQIIFDRIPLNLRNSRSLSRMPSWAWHRLRAAHHQTHPLLYNALKVMIRYIVDLPGVNPDCSSVWCLCRWTLISGDWEQAPSLVCQTVLITIVQQPSRDAANASFFTIFQLGDHLPSFCQGKRFLTDEWI